jgi:hypothetical protein
VTVTAIVFIIAGVTEGGLTTLGIRHYAAGTDPGRARGDRPQPGRFPAAGHDGRARRVTGVAALAGAAREIVIGIPLFGAGTLLTMISASYAVPLQAQLRLGIASGLEFLRQLVNSAGTLALVAAGAGLYAFFGLWAVACLLVTIVTAAIVRSTVRIQPSFHAPTWRRYLGEALAYGVAAAAGLIYFRMAASLMTFLSTDLETGYFAMAFRVLETGTIIPWLLVTSVFPILARAASTDRARLNYATQKVVEVGLIAGVGLALVLLVGAKPVVDLIGGPEFAPFGARTARAVVRADRDRVRLLLVAPAAVARRAARAAVDQRLGRGARVRRRVRVDPAHGAIGGSIDVLLAEVVVGAASVIVLWRRHADVAPDLRPLWKVVAAGLLAGAASIPFGDIVGTVVAGAVYTGVVLALRAVPIELFHALRG